MINRTEEEIKSRWNLSCPPLVSICCITYNHEKFIAEAIDSFLMQITTFPFEIIIGEDCSTDHTLSIIQRYRSKYPNLIKVFTYEKNQGMFGNFKQTYEKCKSPYIAFCEGDDYWTDDHKLQKQIDFLEHNLDFSICCHKSENYHEETPTVSREFPAIAEEKELTIHDILKTNIANTCTFVYRNLDIKFPPFFEKLQLLDWPMHILYAEKGKIKYLPDLMARYRIHPQGVWSGNLHIKRLQHINTMLKEMDVYFESKYHNELYATIRKNTLEQLIYSVKYNLKKNIQKKFPYFFHLLKTIKQR